MKVAEIFADLGFKVEGKDELKSFETSLQNIAAAARNAALALKVLARTPIPKTLKVITGGAPSGTGGGTGTRVLQLNGSLSAQPPILPVGQQPGAQNAVLQGFRSLSQMGTKLFGMVSVALALRKIVDALKDMVRASAAATFSVDKFAATTGISRRELKAWERVAAISDVKAEEMQDTLKKLQQTSMQIRFGMNDAAATAFTQAGISPMQSPTGILQSFQKRFAGANEKTALFFGNMMGLSDDIVYMLRKNGSKFNGFTQGSELSDTQHNAVMELNRAWQELAFNLSLVRDKLVSDLAPALRWVVDTINGASKGLATGSAAYRWTSLAAYAYPGSSVLKAAASVVHNVEVNNTIHVSDSDGQAHTRIQESMRREYSDAVYARPPPYLNQ